MADTIFSISNVIYFVVMGLSLKSYTFFDSDQMFHLCTPQLSEYRASSTGPNSPSIKPHLTLHGKTRLVFSLIIKEAFPKSKLQIIPLFASSLTPQSFSRSWRQYSKARFRMSKENRDYFEMEDENKEFVLKHKASFQKE